MQLSWTLFLGNGFMNSDGACATSATTMPVAASPARTDGAQPLHHLLSGAQEDVTAWQYGAANQPAWALAA